jgi:hypothetical protein
MDKMENHITEKSNGEQSRGEKGNPFGHIIDSDKERNMYCLVPSAFFSVIFNYIIRRENNLKKVRQCILESTFHNL